MANKLIIIGGLIATGKSTFSRELSQRLQIPCFNKDVIREIMADGFGMENEELMNRDKKGSTATFMLLLHIAERFMQTGNACILESNFSVRYPQPVPECEQIRNMADKYNYECLTFAFSGDFDVLSERYINRDSERHWVHAKATDKEAIKNYCLNSKLQEITIGQTVNINTTSFADVDFEGLFAIAGGFVGIG